MKFHSVEQNTFEWMALRCGKVTASSMDKVMAHTGKKETKFGEPAKHYAIKIALEQITRTWAESYSNEHMQRGHEQEPIARMAYEAEYFGMVEVQSDGFFDFGDFGYSPDGRVGDDGLIEIKCVIPSVHYATIKRGSFDPKYKWQLLSALKYTGRKWIDFVSYCADFPEGKRLFIDRIFAKDYETEFDAIDDRMDEFMTLVQEAKETILRAEYIKHQEAA